MRDRLRGRAGEEDGVVLIVVALCLTVFIAAAALAIDVGSFYTTQRHAQTAADAAALAAAQDVAYGNTSSIGADITTLVHQNYPDVSTNGITYTTSYNGDASAVRVEVAGSAPSFFGNALGVSHANVDASAVAGASGTSGPAAIFAKDTNCSGAGVTINGNTLTSGAVHSNGTINDNANNTSIGATTYGGPNGCNFNLNGNNSSVGGPTRDPLNEPWPYDYTTQTFPSAPASASCTFKSSAGFTWNATSAPAGTYCATQGSSINFTGTGVNTTGAWTASTFYADTGNINIAGTQSSMGGTFIANGPNGTITISANNSTLNGIYEATGANGQIIINGNAITGTVTLIANSIQLNGNTIQLQPMPGEHNLLAYQTGTSSMNINGNGYLDGGAIFAPNAPIVFNGDGAGTVTGFMEAQDVTVNGNHLTISGNGPPMAGGGAPSLLQ